MRLRALVPAAVLVGLPAASWAADPIPSLDLRPFRASIDPAAGVYLEPASSPDSLEYNAGIYFNYVHRPITLKNAEGDEVFAVIDHQLTSDLVAGIGISKRAMLGFDLPYVIAQGGDDIDDPASADAVQAKRVIGDSDVPLTALGDLGLVGKFTLIPPTDGEFGGFALALHERFTVPTGDDASYLGEGHVTSSTRLLAEFRVVAVGVHLAAGAKFRAEEERFGCENVPPGPDGSDPCPTRFGHELPFGFGFSFRPQALGIDEDGRWTWFLETYGYLPLAPIHPFEDARLSAMQAAVGARYNVRDVSFMAGLETAVLSGIGTAPLRAVLSVGWAPRVHDADGDGVEDTVDQCRELPEDPDAFDDADGCPEGDNDDDGVPDGSDRCVEAEDEDGYQDDDGCPDPDNDGDGVADDFDGCPETQGPEAPGKNNGCPILDVDGDGLAGAADQCPEQAEDADKFEDADGCPELDNDKDGVNDADDACPVEAGDPKSRGCADADADRDTFVSDLDKCPAEPELFNGVLDDDGCPEGAEEAKAGAALLEVRDKDGAPELRMLKPIGFSDEHSIVPASKPLLRALAAELLQRPGSTVTIGVRPSAAKGGDAGATKRAEAVAAELNGLTRSKAASVVPWNDVSGQPGAQTHGVGFKLSAPAGAKPAQVATPPASAPAAPAPAAPVPPVPKP